MFLLPPSQYQLVSGAGNTGSPQVLQISQGQGGQRVAVPLKMLLQPQVGLQMCTDIFLFHKLFNRGGLLVSYKM